MYLKSFDFCFKNENRLNNLQNRNSFIMINKKKLIENILNQPPINQNTEIDKKKTLAENWFVNLRDQICNDFTKIEYNFKIKNNNSEKVTEVKSPIFTQKKWDRDGGGGGVISIMKGDVFEKVGVNISTVYGKFSEEFKSQIPGAEKTGDFWASGISVVAHMNNPYVPAAHMNTRFLVTGLGENRKFWFGGGCDLTPMLPDKKSAIFFHKELKSMCDKYDKEYYKNYKKWCDDYFFLPHRNEARGEGGIFFDYLNTFKWDKDFDFIKDVGKTFLASFSKIVEERVDKNFSDKEKNIQLVKRGRYVEFNLLYDRGTIFGLNTGGNPEAILMSLPPNVKWE